MPLTFSAKNLAFSVVSPIIPLGVRWLTHAFWSQLFVPAVARATRYCGRSAPGIWKSRSRLLSPLNMSRLRCVRGLFPLLAPRRSRLLSMFSADFPGIRRFFTLGDHSSPIRTTISFWRWRLQPVARILSRTTSEISEGLIPWEFRRLPQLKHSQ
jgi:hypothetical protein